MGDAVAGSRAAVVATLTVSEEDASSFWPARFASHTETWSSLLHCARRWIFVVSIRHATTAVVLLLGSLLEWMAGFASLLFFALHDENASSFLGTPRLHLFCLFWGHRGHYFSGWPALPCCGILRSIVKCELVSWEAVFLAVHAVCGVSPSTTTRTAAFSLAR